MNWRRKPLVTTCAQRNEAILLMVGEHPTQMTLPGEDLKPAWRAACIAYREVRRTGQLDQPAWLAARAAVLQARPDLDERSASRQASAAIHYASVFPRSGCGTASAILGVGPIEGAVS